MASSLRAKVIPKLGWSAIGQLVVEAAKLGTTAVLARLLGPDPFGALAIFLVIVGYARVLTGLGVSAPLIQRPDLEAADRASALWLNLGLGALAAGAVTLAGASIADLYERPILEPLCTLAGGTIFLTSAGLVQRALAFRALRHKAVALVDSVAAIGGGLVGIGLALRGWGAEALAWMFVVRAGMQTAGLWLTAQEGVLARPSWTHTQRLIGFSGPVALSHAIHYGGDNADRALLGGAVGSAELAVYDQAMRLVLAPVNFVAAIVYRVAFPALSSIQEDAERVAAAWRRGLGMTTAVAFPAVLGVVAVARPLTLTLFGEAWEPMIGMVRILGLVGLAVAVNTLVPSILYARARPGLELRANLAGRVAIVCLVVGALPFGLVAVAWGRVAGAYLSALINLWSVARTVPISLSSQLGALIASGVQAGAMALATWALTWILEAHLPPAAILCLAIPFGVLVYGGLARLFGNAAVSDLTQAVGEVLRPTP